MLVGTRLLSSSSRSSAVYKEKEGWKGQASCEALAEGTARSVVTQPRAEPDETGRSHHKSHLVGVERLPRGWGGQLIQPSLKGTSHDVLRAHEERTAEFISIREASGDQPLPLHHHT